MPMRRLWYDFLRVFCRLASVLYFRIRVEGQSRIPAEGPTLLLSNHQSVADPVLLGVSSQRHLTFLAKKSLFNFAPFRWLIVSLNAIPIDREGLGMAGLKETLRRLKRAEIVLIFPEGTRTRDGRVQSLKPGFAALAKRSRATLAPVAICGVYETWPRKQPFPWPGVVQIVFGEPMPPEEVATYGDRELVQEIERRIRDCYDRAAVKRTNRLRWLAVPRRCFT